MDVTLMSAPPESTPLHTVSILGATGYTGREVLRLLIDHPHLEVIHVTSRRQAGTPVADVHPELFGRTDLVLSAKEPEAAAEADLLVSCLPHGVSGAAVASALAASPELRAVDLSGDFRIPPNEYEQAYGRAHPAPDVASEAIYGLPELFRERIAGARLVANPGCYPTAALLALAPLAKSRLLTGATVDAKSGLSGAGANPGPATHFANANENVTAYAPFAHRHAPEMQTHLAAAGADVPVLFVPHLVPMDRGILASAYAELAATTDADALQKIYRDAYAHEPFLRLVGPDRLPATKAVTGTNFADLAVVPAPGGARALVLCAIDNLVKGAAGQAVQNLNLLAGRPETEGLVHRRVAVEVSP
jgi:N-acetyl-gamma-glutamyl-phosphate reductase